MVVWNEKGEIHMDFVSILLIAITFFLFLGFIPFCNKVIEKEGE